MVTKDNKNNKNANEIKSWASLYFIDGLKMSVMETDRWQMKFNGTMILFKCFCYIQEQLTELGNDIFYF